MTPVLQAEKLSKWYGHILGISDITLDIGKGIKGLLGPNGAGKSTFLKVISGQLKPNIGTIRIFGETVFGNHRLFTRVGFCPEQDSFYAEMTGGQFIRFLATLHGFPPAQAGERSERALDQVGLLENRDKLIRAYSFGMRQRLRIAAAILHDPEVLLLDEPLRGIDPLWRIRIIKMIKDFGKEGRTIIVSSHILPEIEAMTDDIILIHQGKVFAEGDIHYIRGLIDAHPHQISIRCTEARRLAQILIRFEFVRSADFDHETGAVLLTTDNRDSFYGSLLNAIIENNLEVEEIASPDDNLQAVFDYLIGR